MMVAKAITTIVAAAFLGWASWVSLSVIDCGLHQATEKAQIERLAKKAVKAHEEKEHD